MTPPTEKYYMNKDLFTIAECMLKAEDSTPALKTVAAETLLAASREGLPLHPEAIRAVWQWLVTCPSSTPWTAAECIGTIDDDKIRVEALDLLRTQNTGRELRSLAAEVLAGDGHAHRLDNCLLVDLVDRARNVDDVRAVSRVVTAVHAARGVEVHLLVGIQARWASSLIATIREEAVTFEATPLDTEFARRMLSDEAVPVRAAVARRIEWTEESAPELTAVVAENLEREQHPEVRAALLHAHAVLLDGGCGRRRRRQRRTI